MAGRTAAAALVLIGAVLASGAYAAETVERIAAVVGDRIILASELVNQVQLAMIQAGADADIDFNELADEFLEEMINDELILSAAKGDTTITVSPDEVQAALDEHIASLVARFPSEDAFLRQLEREGWTKRSYEKRLRRQIHDQVLKQKIISRKLSRVTVSRQEVEAFYRKYVDSLPEIPDRIRLAHILVAFRVSRETEDSIKGLAEQARQVAAQGFEFAEVARDFPGSVGGRIGFVKREDLVPEFARAAFNLQPGAISGPVRTEYGWHVIKNHRRLGDSVDVSQILFPMSASAADSVRARVIVDSLYEELLGGADFKEIAKLHSNDDETRATGGEMEMMDVAQLRPEFVAPLAEIDTGQITPPVFSQLGYHILKLLERQPGRELDIDEDFDILRNMARQEKTALLVTDWVAELRAKVYVDKREINLIQ